jgi:predicted nucleic acid-binding protein
MPIDVLVDSSSFINLYNGGSLEVVLNLANHKFWIGGRIQKELAEREAARIYVEESIVAGRLALYAPNIQVAEFEAMLSKHGLGAGETEAIILAKKNSWQIACDDKKARERATIELGGANVTGSLGLMKLSVDSGLIDCHDGWLSYVQMIANGGYLPKNLPPDYFC